ncbi:Sec-independent protein translocase subunit TatA [Pseudomonas sp. F1_0610]|uniref:Sec-independent protein translocase subunit TatA n=1 Tax=Pseudomonas sp. F1_0610 TaxID=3114284 RepID=UPI0039C1B8E6
MGISMWQLLVILAIVVLLFGTKRLKNIGSDLGGALKGFRKAMNEDGEEQKAKPQDNLQQNQSQTIDGQVQHNKVEEPVRKD